MDFQLALDLYFTDGDYTCVLCLLETERLLKIQCLTQIDSKFVLGLVIYVFVMQLV